MYGEFWRREDTNMLNLVVGDADGAGLALGELGHSWEELAMSDFIIRTRYLLTLPGVHNRDTIVNDHIATLDSAVGNEWEVRITLLEGNRPVNKVKLGQSAIVHKSHWVE